MKLKNQLPIERLIAKIDNDFNISESDWIPRVAAWVIDALSQMKVLPMEYKSRTLPVSERIAQFPCTLNATELKVYDSDGIEIKAYNENNNCGCSQDNKEIALIDDTNKSGINFMHVASIIDSNNRNFVLDGNNIELNFDTDNITVKSYEVATYHDDYYDTECPYIIDDGLLLEALAWYCMFKYLSRGSKHMVYDLKSPNVVVNPWLQWNALRPKAAASAKKALNDNLDNGWNNFFYNSTFLPRS